MIVANKSLKTQKTYWVVGFSAFWFLRLSGYFKMFVANLKKRFSRWMLNSKWDRHFEF